MAYTYTAPVGGVFASPVSNVRYLVGDTVPAAPFSLDDGEIQYELTQVSGSVNRAASRVARRMATNYARTAATQKSVGNLSISKDYSAQAKWYATLSADLRTNGSAGVSAAGPVFTGESSPAEPVFYLGQFDHDHDLVEE